MRRKLSGFDTHRAVSPTIVAFLVAVILGGVAVIGSYYLVAPGSIVGGPIRNAISALSDILG